MNEIKHSWMRARGLGVLLLLLLVIKLLYQTMPASLMYAHFGGHKPLFAIGLS